MDPVNGGMNGEAVGTGGAESVMNRLSGFGPRWALYGLVVCLLQTVDVIASWRSAGRGGLDLPLWRVLADGYSSAAAIVLLYPLMRGVARATPPWSCPPLRIVASHAAGIAAYWIAFLLGFSLIRMGVYTLNGETYHPALAQAAVAVVPSVLVVYPLTVLGIWGSFGWKVAPGPPAARSQRLPPSIFATMAAQSTRRSTTSSPSTRRATTWSSISPTAANS